MLALILEEVTIESCDIFVKFLFHLFQVAIDSPDVEEESRLLRKAERLHKFSLNLARKNFGEANVHTAKQYGNLGRLYQTTKMFELSEKMHLKSIAIKEAKLGVSDYEVALSIGHLASLYNYDMKKYVEAEQLYLRSITIGKKVFGPAYSGLEYDYLGLQEVETHNKNVNVFQIKNCYLMQMEKAISNNHPTFASFYSFELRPRNFWLPDIDDVQITLYIHVYFLLLDKDFK